MNEADYKKILVLVLGDAKSIHMVKWIQCLLDLEFKVLLISMHETHALMPKSIIYKKLFFGAPIGYIMNFLQVNFYLLRLRPKIYNVHYASGYGMLSLFSFYRNIVISIWGSDVYEFPFRSILHKHLIKLILTNAKLILSTSEVMAQHVIDIFKNSRLPPFIITPFGVDTNQFLPNENNKLDNKIRIGIVKALSKQYGIDILLEAFSLLLKKVDSSVDIELHIAGDGELRDELKCMAKKFGVAERTFFHGAIENQGVPDFLSEINIFASLSIEESFGVAALEASSSALPVVVSDAPGYVETVVNGITGVIVPRGNAIKAADALFELITNPAIMKKMGASGRERVINIYSLEAQKTGIKKAYEYILNN